MDIYELCGYSAGILFASSLIPQVYKSFKTKELNDISIIWQLIFILALVLGIIYSYHNNLKPIYICSFIELILMIILLFLKINSIIILKNVNHTKNNQIP
jgi:MtN3 and saliva related transmembrane protein